MSVEPNLEDLKHLVQSLQSTVTKTTKSTRTTSIPVISMYPTAGPNSPPGNTGIIVDDKYGVTDLLAAQKINPPDGLHWLQIKSYEDFESYLTDRGFPNYVSLDGDLGVKGKDGVACAKLLVKLAKAAKLKELPNWECHSPILTTKNHIEAVLLAY